MSALQYTSVQCTTLDSTFQAGSYYYHLLSLGDPRVEKWPLMASPLPTIGLLLLYLLVSSNSCLMLVPGLHGW